MAAAIKWNACFAICYFAGWWCLHTFSLTRWYDLFQCTSQPRSSLSANSLIPKYESQAGETDIFFVIPLGSLRQGIYPPSVDLSQVPDDTLGEFLLNIHDNWWWFSIPPSSFSSSSSSSSTELPQLPLLLTTLKQVHQWFNLGLHLGVPYHTPKTIEREQRGGVEDSKRELLAAWLQGQGENPANSSWLLCWGISDARWLNRPNLWAQSASLLYHI